MEGLFEYRKIEYPCTATVSAGTAWEPTTKDARVVDNAELAADEKGELLAVEICNPDKQALKFVYPKIDDKDADDYVLASGLWDSLMFPPLVQAFPKVLIVFGKPNSTNLLENTTLKYAKKALPCVVAGATDITKAFTIAMHSYVYKHDAFKAPGVFGVLRSTVDVVDPTENRSYTVRRPDLAGKAVGPDIWTKLPGGFTQDTPKIWPLVRFATNTKDISIERDYTFNYADREVEKPEQGLWFKPTDLKIVVVEGLGVRAHDNSAYHALKIRGEYRPSSKFYVKPRHNEIIFGKTFPILADSAGGELPLFYPVPKLADKAVIFAATGEYVGDKSEAGGVVHRATTAAIPAGSIITAVTGRVIELYA